VRSLSGLEVRWEAEVDSGMMGEVESGGGFLNKSCEESSGLSCTIPNAYVIVWSRAQGT
jgi:hypothetical protein